MPTVDDKKLDRFLHPDFAPTDLEAAASASLTNAARFGQVADATPFLSIAGLAAGQFRLRVRLANLNGGPCERSPLRMVIVPASGNVTSVTAATGEVQSLGGIGTAEAVILPDTTTTASAGWIDLIATLSAGAGTTCGIQLYHAEFVAVATAYATA
jgi:hypothetical protein